jgi:hypothetical protein
MVKRPAKVLNPMDGIKGGTIPASRSQAYATEESNDEMMGRSQDKRVKCREYTI